MWLQAEDAHRRRIKASGGQAKVKRKSDSSDFANHILCNRPSQEEQNDPIAS